LEEERQANQRLVQTQHKTEIALKEEKQAKQILAQAQHKTKQQMAIGVTILAVSVVGAIVAAIMAGKAIHAANYARYLATLQRIKALQETQAATEEKNRAQQVVKTTKQDQLKTEIANIEANKKLTSAFHIAARLSTLFLQARISTLHGG
jgi:hypothetical protein